EIMLEPGDKLFLYTDGVPEASNAEQEFYGTTRMIEALNDVATENPEKILKHVRKSVDAFVDKAEQFDDLTMLCLEYKGV
ncbi:MAG: serine/threonine-protein phosphatase, partial [Lachnospiraceae bacterium]|nr:serine/threonine-protein phosphatase [Lachnospiraceae bacterium]